MHLSSIVIGVKNLEVSRAFYEQVFGIEFEEFRPPFACFMLDGIEFDIEEDSPERSSGRAAKYIGRATGLAFKVEHMGQVLDCVEKLGWQVVSPPKDMSRGWTVAKFSDRDSNIFIIEAETHV